MNCGSDAFPQFDGIAPRFRSSRETPEVFGGAGRCSPEALGFRLLDLLVISKNRSGARARAIPTGSRGAAWTNVTASTTSAASIDCGLQTHAIQPRGFADE